MGHYLLFVGTSNASSVTMTASCLCAMLIDLTSEEFLLSCSEFDDKTLGSLSELIVRSLQQVTSPYSVIEIILFRVVVRLCVSYPLEWLFFYVGSPNLTQSCSFTGAWDRLC